jgi:hypothetical protein
MFLTVHATAGVLAGSLTANPTAAFALGVLSHAVLDIIPHGDEKLGPECTGPTCTHREEVRFTLKLATVDAIVMVAVLAFLLTPWRTTPTTSMLAGFVGGVIPDILQGLGMAFPRIRPFARFKKLHDFVHVRLVTYDPPFATGMVVQLLTLVALVIVHVR